MAPTWEWIVWTAMPALLGAQQFHIYRMRRDGKKRDELFQIVTENAADMIALVDVKGRRLYNSPAYKRILGYSPAELSETSAFEQIHPDDRYKILEAAREARSTGVGKKLEYRIRHKDGSWRVLESVAGTIRDQNGDVSKLVIVNRDITDRKRAEEQAEHNSFHDSLTGLPNRRLFLDRLEHVFERSRRGHGPQFAVLFVDLDRFKAFNDTMGTSVGDQVIAEVGRRLGACLREEDTAARPGGDPGAHHAVLSRLGGDEFTILIEAIRDPSDAMRVGQRILAALAALFLVEGREVQTSASIGIALSTAAHIRGEDALQDAEAAARRAQALGGGRCELYDEAMHARAVGRLKLESELRAALEKQEFRLFYQPIVQLESGDIRGFEALVRWQHPGQGLISPDKFLAAAEDSGLLAATGEWILRTACRQLQHWTEAMPGSEALAVAVNVSPRQLAGERFAHGVEKILWETGLAPERLHLELGESVADAEAQLAESVLARLKSLHVRVTLDDFGAGHSSLAALQRLPLDAVKIDRPLVAAMLADRRRMEMLELIITIGQRLRLKTIAVGVESARQVERLRAIGCDLGQGYYFSPPVDAAAAEKLLRQHTLGAARAADAR
ncbi:MAG TPA: bifunctional diguanylate cyclase/phosphodiesterase [Candidatus Binatia bacterium]|nr:bifunctional diguanylate cyclase/phosphodiesterase [Candidatus Binatia bacterium]